MTSIIGDRKSTSVYDPDLADKMNKKVAEEIRQEELARRLEEARKKREPAEAPMAQEPQTEPPAPAIVQPSQAISAGKYILMPRTSTYALGVHALQEACVAENNPNQPKIVVAGREIYRANTFLENILARMNDWETIKNPDGSERTLDKRKSSFATWLDSCCGIAYKAKSTKLKLQLVCPQLMGIDKDFNHSFMPVDYASFSGTELDSNSRNFVHDAWLVLLDEKTDVYTDYLKMLKVITGNDIVPIFWKRQNTADDELRAVFVNNLGNYSSAYGNYYLINYGRFLRGSP